MREMIKMIVVLTILCSFSGGLLAAIRNGTKDKIETQQLTFVKGPAIMAILEGASNAPIDDRFKIVDQGIERNFFIGVFDGKASSVVFESSGKGFGGDIGVMVGVNISNDNIVGVGITTHSETPGVGSKAKTDPSFAAQFKDKPLGNAFQVKSDGGQVDALTGATVTSRGVSVALTDAGTVYQRLKPQIIDKLEAFK
jgi:electron transport complex protein RnfG